MPQSDKIQRSDAEWRARLDTEQYAVCRCKATEPAFSGTYYDFHSDGQFVCVCCDAVLFDSQHKYDSGSGWPSFTAAAAPNALSETTDHSHGMRRTEVLCARCDAHLGHVFPDGPPPSGLRYCINSVALRFCARDGGSI